MSQERTILDDIMETLRAVERKVDKMTEVPADVQAGLAALPQTGQEVIAYIQQLRTENQALLAQLQPLAALNAQLQAALPAPPATPAEQPQPAIDPATGQPVQPAQ